MPKMPNSPEISTTILSKYLIDAPGPNKYDSKLKDTGRIYKEAISKFQAPLDVSSFASCMEGSSDSQWRGIPDALAYSPKWKARASEIVVTQSIVEHTPFSFKITFQKDSTIVQMETDDS